MRERRNVLFLGGGHGSLLYCSIELFSSGNSVILIVMCGIVVSSSSAVCGFAVLANVFGKSRSFTVFCGIAALFMFALLSNVDQIFFRLYT